MHHALNRVHSALTRKRIGLVDVGAALVTLLPAVDVLTAVEPLPLGVALAAVTVGCGAGGVDSTERPGAPPAWTVLPHIEPVHLNAGRSFGTGGVFGAVGIVGGGTAPACTLRGITAKFG